MLSQFVGCCPKTRKNNQWMEVFEANLDTKFMLFSFIMSDPACLLALSQLWCPFGVILTKQQKISMKSAPLFAHVVK